MNQFWLTITEKKKHYRLIYYGNGMYKTTLAKTPSDHRAGKNMVTDITKKVY